jgi:hypothetical protein
MTSRLRKCSESTIAGRLAKAEQFLDGAVYDRLPR